MNQYSLPKPLNYIEGKPAIEKVLQHAPFQEFHFIVSPALQQYQFESFIRASFKDKTCHFHHLPYITRGAVESAWLGTLDFHEEGEPIVFLDNDILYSFPPSFSLPSRKNAFLGYSEDYSTSEAFSFLTMKEGLVEDIQEKKRISNQFVCGVYGFASLAQFRSYAKELLHQPQEQKEMYMSCLYSNMLKKGEKIEPIYFSEPIHHLGSLKEITSYYQSNSEEFEAKPLRICFDLDHTLVTSPTEHWDYRTVEPISKMINFARKMSAKGHTIIVYTARRMKTHQHNVGAVVKDCAQEVFRTLERFSIPYDELIFGKPIADVYIDDKALNPYLNSLSAFGFFSEEEEEKPLNSLHPNRFHQINVEEDIVVKKGLKEGLEGEAYYYRVNGSHQTLNKFMPRCISYQVKGEFAELRMEHLKGIPFAKLFQMELLTIEHLNRLLHQVKILHNAYERGRNPSLTSVKDNYTEKMKKRLSLIEQSSLLFHSLLFHSEEREEGKKGRGEKGRGEKEKSFDEVKEFCLSTLTSYTETLNEKNLTNHIHGDLWFSNILLTFDNHIKWFDMRGSCGKQLTTGGDPLYDFAKLYQSFLGYDLILLGKEPTPYHHDFLLWYKNYLEQEGISSSTVRNISICLMVGTIPFLEDEVVERVWNWIYSLLKESYY